MSDIEYVVNTLQQHGGVAATTVAGLYAAKRLFGPTFDMLGTRLKDVTDKRIENLGKISARADQLSPNSDGYPHIRVTQRVLNEATLYDDNVQHTYVAGLLAGSRNDDGSDDRPVFYLSVIDSLTASQLRLFHALYAAVAQSHRGTWSNNGPIARSLVLDVAELNANLMRLEEGDENENDEGGDGWANLFALEHIGLIAMMGMNEGPNGTGELHFAGTRIGALLFDWAYGFNDNDIRQFGMRNRPEIGLPEMIYTTF